MIRGKISAAWMVATVHVDSLAVFSILCAVEPIVGFELSERVVRAGGYISVESALEHLHSRVAKIALDVRVQILTDR